MIYSNTAIVYSVAGQNEAAKPLFEKALSMIKAAPLSVSQGNLASIYANYALCIGEMGDLKEARKYLKLAKDTGYSEANFKLICDRLHINPKSVGRRFFF